MQAQRADAPGAGGFVMPAAYEKAWRSLKVRSWLPLAVWLFYIPAMLVMTASLNSLSPGLGDRAGSFLFGVWVLLFFATGLYLIAFRCPNCGGWFGSSNFWNSPYARKCLHCGQPRYGLPLQGPTP